jgi:hypothetical protein
LTLSSFVHDFKYSTAHATRVNSLAVGLQQAGAFLASILVWPITERLGRRRTLIICFAIFIIGVIIETINTHSMAAFYVGRVVAGIGLGAATVVVPMFSSEIAPKEIRGQIGNFFQWFYTFGESFWKTVLLNIGSEQNRHLHFVLGRLRCFEADCCHSPPLADSHRTPTHPSCSPRIWDANPERKYTLAD